MSDQLPLAVAGRLPATQVERGLEPGRGRGRSPSPPPSSSSLYKSFIACPDGASVISTIRDFLYLPCLPSFLPLSLWALLPASSFRVSIPIYFGGCCCVLVPRFMAGICCGVVGDTEAAAVAPLEPTSRGSIRRRLEPVPLKLVADAAMENGRKRRKFELRAPKEEKESEKPKEIGAAVKEPVAVVAMAPEHPKFGLTSVCGRRRDMEDAVSVQPWLCSERPESPNGLHLYGVFDGHGCSHVAMRCKHRLHEIVKEEIERRSAEEIQWKETMERSFEKMDSEVHDIGDGANTSRCRCELQTPQCDAVGSTAVVAVVTQDKIVVSNCGDSRAVLCRNGVAIPLSTDHKPDRPDELDRIQNAGGRVIYWDGARVLGVLAMSRAIGDNYLKPYVIPDPEVVVTDRTPEDECLILASDGLWDVVSNDTACGVARMCLKSQKPPSPPRSPGSADVAVGAAAESSDGACSDASILLTKLALARRSSDNVSVVVIDLRKEIKAEAEQ